MNLLPIVIIGAGGHATVVVDIVLKLGKYHIFGYTAPEQASPAERLKLKYLGDDSILPKMREQGVALAALGVGGVGDNRLRSKLYEHIRSLGFTFPPLVHPAATVAGEVLLPEALLVGPGAVVNPGVKIGVNAVINSGAVVEHDCSIGGHVHVAPGAVLCGGVRVGNLVHVGAGAVVIQGVTLGEGAVVGAGAVVLRDVDPWMVVAGNPAKPIKLINKEDH